MKNRAIEIVYLPIAEIHPYENNPRNNEKAVEAVMRSIDRFGIRTPAIVDKNNILIAGHTRVIAAERLGFAEYPCVRADDLSENEAKAFRLADNRIQEDSQWDTETLAQEFAALRGNGFDLKDTGFDDFEISGIDMSDFVGDEGEFFTSENSEEASEEAEEETNGEESSATGEETEKAFVCIFCCKTDEDKALVASMIGEKNELRQRYTWTIVNKVDKRNHEKKKFSA